jgi:hypothetical protein
MLEINPEDIANIGDADQLRHRHHEAGHALAYLTVGQQFHYLTVEPRQNSLGHVFGRVPDDGYCHPAMCIVGPLAQDRFVGGASPQALGRGPVVNSNRSLCGHKMRGSHV